MAGTSPANAKESQRVLIADGAQRRPSAFDLVADQAGVEAVAGDQFGMASGLDQTAVIEHRQQVGVAHGREAMGDDDRRAVAHQGVECSAHQRFADRVQMRGRLVEHQCRRVFQKSAGDRHTLALAARQLDAALADLRVEALGQAVDKISERRLVECLADRRLVGLGPGERHVGAQRVVEQVGVL